MKQTLNFLGRHMLLELYQCPQDILDNINKIEAILVDVVKQINATLINKTFHHFSPHGISGVVVIAESHVTIHTWPEHDYAAIDLFSCDDSIDFELAEKLLVEKFAANTHQSQIIRRGEV